MIRFVLVLPFFMDDVIFARKPRLFDVAARGGPSHGRA